MGQDRSHEGIAPALGAMPVKRSMALGRRVLLRAVYGTVTTLVSANVRP